MKKYYSLDFEDLKADIKAHMQTSDSFKDYNFEGSAASQLIDILAYATQYQSFYLNQSLNEFFMHTVQLTDNVYKLAHQLNYLPKRKSAPYLVVDFERNSDVTILIPKFTKFTMGEIFLTNIEDILIDTNDIQSITLYEGEPKVELFASDGSTDQIYELENRETIDNDEFYVYVDTPDPTPPDPLDPWIYGTVPWINLMKDSFDTFEDAFYARYFEKFYVAFDNGNLFNMPEEFDQIRIVYIKTNGTTNNGLTGDIVLSTPGDIANSEFLDIVTSDTLKNGTDEETKLEIKNRAPLFYVTQNRAVTEKDHNIIAKRYSKYNIFSDVILWGGERETIDEDGIFDEYSDVKDVGHVYVTAVKANTLVNLSQTEIDDYIEFLNKQKFVAIFMKYIHSSKMKISPTINISFKEVLNISTDDVQTQINEYLDTNEGYNKNFYLADLIRFVNTIDVVEYNYISFTTKITVSASEATSAPYIKIIRVNGEILPGSISATIDGESLWDAAGILYWNTGTPEVCGTVSYTTTSDHSPGWIRLTKQFTDTEHEILFEYVDKEKVTLERENFLHYEDIILNVI